MMIRTNVGAGPISAVTGANGTDSPSSPVFDIRFTPSGAFNCDVKNGLSPWLNTRTPCVSIHSKNV